MKKRSQGMTLIELLIAMLVLAILMSIAVPSFREFAADSRTSAVTSDLVTALSLARSEALRRANLVIACASTDLAGCSGANDWSPGWIVFSDPNGNGTVEAGELLQTWEGNQTGITAAANADRAVYTGMGMSRLPPGLPSVTFDIRHSGCSGPRARQVVMSISGSLQTTKIAC
jgi:type IV fimbrial biogenesis protein FimT